MVKSPTENETSFAEVSENQQKPLSSAQVRVHFANSQSPIVMADNSTTAYGGSHTPPGLATPSSQSSSSSPVPSHEHLDLQPKFHRFGPQSGLDPEQMYILSGPFTCYGQPTMIAYPVPRGATVIATPSMRPVPMNPAPLPIIPSILSQNPSPSVSPDPQKQNLHQAGIRNPSALIWNTRTCPEGRMIPLRQTQPPVYFYHNCPQNIEA